MGGCKGKATRFKDSSEKFLKIFNKISEITMKNYRPKKLGVSDVGDKVILVTLLG